MNKISAALTALLVAGSTIMPEATVFGRSIVQGIESTQPISFSLSDQTDYSLEITGDEWPDQLSWKKRGNQYQFELQADSGENKSRIRADAPQFFLPRKYFLEDVTGDDAADLVITLTDTSSGGSLVYWVIEGGKKPKLLTQSEAYLQGTVEVAPGRLAVSYSVYEEGDSNALPSKRITEEWGGSPWKLLGQSTSRIAKQREEIEVKANKNPPYHEIEKMIEEVAAEYSIPAVLLKAVAWQESGWRQFDSAGNPLISFDGGIGIMQLTNQTRFDQEKLKKDIRYNLRAGAQVLLEKRGYTKSGLLPSIGKMDQSEMESWYFALWAYNGWSVYNNPHNIPNKFRKYATYQDSVLALARNSFAQPITRIPKSLIPKEGVPNGNIDYDTPLPIHQAGEDLARRQIKVGDTVEVMRSIDSLNVRQSPGLSGKVLDTLAAGERATVLKGATESDGFLWYQVKSKDGTGYVAGHYLNAVRDTSISLAELLDTDPSLLSASKMAEDGRRVYLEGENLTVDWSKGYTDGGIALALMSSPLRNLWVEWTEGKRKQKQPDSTDDGFLKGVSVAWDEANVPQLRSVQVFLEQEELAEDAVKQLKVIKENGDTVDCLIKESKSIPGYFSVSPLSVWEKKTTYTISYLNLPIAQFTTMDKDPVKLDGFETYPQLDTDVSLNKKFDIKFTKKMDPKTVVTKNIWLEDDGGNQVNVKLSTSSDNRHIYLQSSSTLKPDAYYFCKITKGLRTSSGVPLKENMVYIFHTEFP